MDVLERAKDERRQRRAEDQYLAAVWSSASNECMEILGFDCKERKSVQRDLMMLGQDHVHIAEVPAPARVKDIGSRFGLTPGLAFDIRSCWDLTRLEKRRKLWDYLEQERPMLIVGSWQCKALDRLQSLTRESPHYESTLKEGLTHLKFLMDICIVGKRVMVATSCTTSYGQARHGS